ncbi:endolytic transglycosylase MltG [Fulvivirgaceae bacterium BMA12]|uniref:Endolytic murein transglycosylase n=1 Tax=Agaribacillus aureus TaxID=3051825 RepID=A0ABT8LCG1_9BACT|nr:endolytic transglycosylase MltG [Fulvivirgaceae bacterium BMA12]
MKKRNIFLVLFIGFWVVVSSLAFYGYQAFKSPNILVGAEAKVLLIHKGADFKTVQDSLRTGRFLKDPVAFGFLAKILKYHENVKPGRYLLKPNMSNLEAIRYLRSGNQLPVDVTFNNIRLKEDLAEKITKNLEITKAAFLAALNDPAMTGKYGYSPENIMTMFLPNTYEVYWNVSVEGLFDRMSQEHQKFWSEERKGRATEIGLSPVEVSVLASIVYAENSKTDEIPRIAGLYMNRLKRNIALQADPTLIFAAQDFTIKRVLNKHKEIESPYNTYKYTGLPPGPINLPPVVVLKGVLNYEDHNYIYMCAKEDFSGYHNFATNLREHLNNAARYQRALNKAKLYR